MATVCLAVSIFAALPAGAEVLIPRATTGWRYNATGVDLGSTWKNSGYDDSAWSGPAQGPLGNNLEGGNQLCTTVFDVGPSGARFPVVYYRRTFNVAAAAGYSQLTVRLQCDDSAVVYLNGTQVVSDGVQAPGVFGYEAGQTRAGADEVAYRDFSVPPSALVNGVNVIAVENHQVNATSSDLQMDLELEGVVDNSAPIVTSVDPPQGANLISLTLINIVFSEPVYGVNASDLLINSVPATGFTSNNNNNYSFQFSQPPTGSVQVAFAAAHGITDQSFLLNPFAGASWTYNLDTNLSTRPNIVISEFLADNENGIKDEDGDREDWIELYNVGPLDGNLNGWFLTDTPTNLTKWRLPALVLANTRYAVIWASDKNRINLNGQLHTNFKLGNNAGGYLALVDAQTNIVSAFSNYPAQPNDISYGRDRNDPGIVGYLTTPTPGAQNIAAGPNFMGPPIFSHQSGVYTASSIALTISNTNASGGTIRYTTDGSIPNSGSTIYTGPINLTANSTIKARIFGTLLPSDIRSRNFIFLDASAANFSSRMPIMIISTEGRSIPANVPPGSPRVRGAVFITDVVQDRSAITGAADVHEHAAFEIYGQTSAGFPKLPIRMEVQDAYENDKDVGVLGMPADSDWRLRNPYNDKTYLNDYLGFTLWEEMGHYSVRRQFVEVFRDVDGGKVTYPGDYYGVMLLCETIKVNNDRVDIAKLSPYATNEPAVSGGYIFKRDKDSVGDVNFPTLGGQGHAAFSAIPLKLHEPKPNEIRFAQGVTTSYPGPGYTPSGTNQMDYLRRFLGAMERALYTNVWTTQTGTNHYSHYLDVIRFADQFLHVEFTKQIDGYRLSDYFSKDRNGKVGPGPVWDWNLAFGNADYAQGGMTNTWYFEITGETDHPWARRLISGTSGATGTSGDPEFLQLIADRWAMFRTNTLNGTNMNRRIDELATWLSESAARDLYSKYRAGLIGTYTWPNPSGSGDGRDVDFVNPTNYLGPIETVAPTTRQGSIIGQMKKWVLGRYLWMDSQFATPPTISQASAMVTNGSTVTIIPPSGHTLFYRLDGLDPRAFGGSVRAGTLSNTSPVTVTVNANVEIFARTRKTATFRNTWSGPSVAAFYTTIPSLRITEIMFNPAPPPIGSTNSTSDFEYIEVKNVGATPLNVGAYSLAGGIQFEFPNVVLNAGQSAVIVANTNAFQTRYGSGAMILGTFTGRLNNAGDNVALFGSLGEPIVEVPYVDNWYPGTDGFGFSLVVVNENAPIDQWGLPTQWRVSSALGGSPGANDPAAPLRPFVVVNEVRAHSSLADGDAIELHNTTSLPVDIGGWFLTDDFNTPKKYTIPGGTTIPANGYFTFYGNSLTSFSNAFGLGSGGDDIYVFSGSGGNLTGHAHGFDFGASFSNATFGRYLISSGDDHFVWQSTPTLGATNSGPLVGPIVINEISYHPPDTALNGIPFNNLRDEFIELHNVSGSPAPLFDPAHPTNTWRLTDAVDYSFPTNVTIPAGGHLIVVGFDPANATLLQDFRNNNYVPAGVPIYGPWDGNLDNESGVVELKRPALPETNGLDHILVERVKYRDTAPWPVGADGYGLTLQRVVRTSYANDPTNWVAAGVSAGGNFVPGGVAPTITSQPGTQTNIFGTTVTLTAAATGTQPLRYQWRLNGVNVSGATNSSYVIQSFQAEHAGTYTIFVNNSGGFALGTNFNVLGRVQLQIVSHPQDRTSVANSSTNFSVAAIGSGVLRYQWKHNGTNVNNATNNTLTLTGISVANEGTYVVVVSDDYETLTSQPATLTVVSPPVRTLMPFSMTVVEGQQVMMSVTASGTLPINFRWRTNGQNISNVVFIVSPAASTIVIPSVTTNFNGLRFTVAITNIAGQAPLTTNAILTVLADTDHDGLPDVWETGRPNFSPTDNADALRDDDGDGMKNGQEYFAGTDPFDPTSYLKVNLDDTGPATVSFNAVPDRAYTVLYADSVAGPWLKLGDALNRPTSRVETFTDPTSTTNRYYKLVVPIQP
jgi:hypothetical protein